MTSALRPIDRHATLPQIECSVRAALEVDVVLIETGYLMTAVNESALQLVATLQYATWRRDDGSLMAQLRVGGLPTRLDLLENEGLRCAVVSARERPSGSRLVIYVTGDRRDAPRPRTAAGVLGIAETHNDPLARRTAPSNFESDSSAVPKHRLVGRGVQDEATVVDQPAAYADRLLELRVELLAEIWGAFLCSRDHGALVGLHAGDVLQRRAQRVVKRPIRRRREGDNVWLTEHDEVIEHQFTSGRLVSEIARRLDRPAVLTAERLKVLGYPSGPWPYWDDDHRQKCALMIEAGVDLPAISRSLGRSPWDIARTLAANGCR